MPRNIVLPLLVLLIAGFVSTQQTFAADDAAKLFPASTLVYAEFDDPPAILDGVMKHELMKKAYKLDVYKKATSTPEFAKLTFALMFIEAQLGMKWNEAVKKLTHGGIVAAFDPATNGVALIATAKDKESLETITSKIMQMARQDAKGKGKPDPFKESMYRDITVYGTKDGGGFTFLKNHLVIANKSELGKQILDAWLDSPESSLATQPWFTEAKKTKANNPFFWAAFNTDLIKQKIEERHDNPGVEIIGGGLLEALKAADSTFGTASITGKGNQLNLSVRVPFDRTNVSERRQFFFGKEGRGGAPLLRKVPGQLACISAYRDVSEMWLRAGDLFVDRTLDKITEADATLTTLFAGKDFGEDILGQLYPTYNIVVAKQNFDGRDTIPSIRLPAFSIVATMKDPETNYRDFRRIFQSLVGFLNVAGAQNGQPQLDLEFDKVEGGEMISAQFVPEDDDKGNENAKINFNFSPTVAFHDRTFILSSTKSLAKSIIEMQKNPIKPGDDGSRDHITVNTNVDVDAAVLKSVLKENESHLIAQNMLDKGHSRKEAEQEISTLLDIITLFKSLNLALETDLSSIQLKTTVEYAGGDDE